MDIDKDWLEVINSGITLLVGGIGAIVAYKASVKGAKMQIEEERRKLREESEEREKAYNEAVETFIASEIKGNFIGLHASIGDTSWMEARLMEPKPSSYTFEQPPEGFSFKEYDNLKYELIKAGGEKIKDIVEIYEMFSLTTRKRHMIAFTQKEYEQFKHAYMLCLKNYHDR